MKSEGAAKSGWLRSLLGIAAGLLIAAVVMRLSGYPVGQAFGALASGATGIQSGPASGPNDIPLGVFHISKYLLGQSLSRMTPLLFTGLAVAVGLRAGLFNIGAQGQLILGGLTAAVVGSANLPPTVAVPVVLLSAAVAGGLWGAIAGALKAYRGVHEVISTIMLNYIAANLANYLVTHNLKDSTGGIEQTREIAASSQLTEWVTASGLTSGLLFALIAAALVTFLIRRTALGYRIRAVGLGAEAARASGVDVGRVTITTLAISGGLAGLAGAVEILSIQHRYLKDGLGDYGFDGIAVALLGGLDGGGVALSALFFGMLAKGAVYMKLQASVPEEIATIVEAIVILFIGVRTFGPRLGLTRQRRNLSAPVPASATPSQTARNAAGRLENAAANDDSGTHSDGDKTVEVDEPAFALRAPTGQAPTGSGETGPDGTGGQPRASL